MLILTLGWLELALGALGTTMILVVYRPWIQPWQHREGATDQEAHRAMPGDDRIPDAASTTPAIAIAAHPSSSGRGWCSSATTAGCYSYD